MRWTDKTIPVICAECELEVNGVDAMQGHILEFHGSYSAVEAVNFARLWADDAYEREEEFEKAYYEDRALERGIERLEAKHP